MATNMTREDTSRMSVVVTHPTAPVSNDPVRYGLRTGVALVDEAEGGNPTGYTTVDFGDREWKLSVKGVNDSGNSAVAVGDPIYYVDADTPPLSKKASGYFFGFASEVVTSGATASIKVVHVQSPGSGTLSAGGVNTTQLAANAVTAAKLTATLATGFIPIPLASLREIVTNDIVNTAGDAGVLASNTTPILARVNGATDQKLRVQWAASNSDPVTFDFPYPPDLDDTADITIKMLAASGGATNSPVMAVTYFEGLGDTNAGGNTAAITGTTIALYSRTIAAADIGTAPNAASVMLTPAAHTTDVVNLYALWVEYTRK